MVVEEIGNAQEDVIGYCVQGHVEPGEFIRALGDRTVGPCDLKDVKQTHMNGGRGEQRADVPRKKAGDGRKVV